MSRFVFFLAVASLAVVNRSQAALPEPDSVYVIDTCTGDTTSCPPPVLFAGEVQLPPYAHMHQVLSPDGKRLAFVANDGQGAWVIDLRTLKQTTIEASPHIPGANDFAWADLAWCPYDPNQIAMVVASVVGGSKIVENLCIYNISNGASTLITPEDSVPNGAYLVTIDLMGWLKGSTPASDTFMLTNGYYVPQTQSLIALPIPLPVKDSGQVIFGYSSDSLHTASCLNTNPGSDFYGNSYGVSGPFFFDDSLKIGFPPEIAPSAPDQFDTIKGYYLDDFQSFFSPNDSLCAIKTIALHCPGPDPWPSNELIIYKVSDPSTPLHVINFRKNYCTYSFWGMWPTWLTDSTLAVSMHHDGDTASPLWEINLNGDIVRQLTFVPANYARVQSAPASLPLRVFPNPARNELEIASGARGTARLFDLLGRKLLEAKDNGSGVTLDVSKLTPGMYCVRVGSQFSKILITH